MDPTPVTNGCAYVLEGVIDLLATVARSDAPGGMELEAINEPIGQRSV